MKYFYSIFILIIISCIDNAKNNDAPINLSTTLNLINIPSNLSYKFKSGSIIENSIFDLQYYNNNGVINYKFSKSKEQIGLDIKDDYLEIILTLNAVNEISFLIKRGDSIDLDFNNYIPISKKEIGLNCKHDLDYNLIANKNIFKTRFPNYLMTKGNPLNYIDNIDSLLMSKSNFKEIIYQKAKTELNKERIFLDSLKNNKLISKLNYDYCKSKNFYYSLHADLKNSNVNNNEKDKYILNDSLIKFKFYRDFIKDFVYISYNLKKIEVSNGRILDFKYAFDVVSKSYELGDKTKNFLLFSYCEGMCVYNKKDETIKYLDEYLKITGNKDLYDKLLNNYSLKNEQLKTNSSNDIKVKDSNHKNFELQQYLSSSKLVYIDFWASWCAPCREKMPFSKKIEEKYKDKGVEFLYISIDKNYEAWQKANSKEKLDNKNSFLATNYPEANYYKENQVKSIPRYMIFYKGKLVNSNAPSPDSPEIEKEFEKYLSKN